MKAPENKLAYEIEDNDGNCVKVWDIDGEYFCEEDESGELIPLAEYLDDLIIENDITEEIIRRLKEIK